MHSRKAFYAQAFTVFTFGSIAVSLLIVTYASLNIKVAANWATSYGPWLEEGIKYIAILVIASRIPLNTKAIPFIGVGFGAIEAVRHLEVTGYASPRAFLAHLTFGFVMAFFFYMATKTIANKFKGVWYAMAYLIPVALHLIYNIYFGQ